MKNDLENPCTIYLVRHGEAEGNAKGLLQGHYDVPLTEKGKSQISELAAQLDRRCKNRPSLFF